MSLFEKLASKETEFVNQQFLAPVIKRQCVRVRVAEIVMSLIITKPRNFEGWGVFKATSFKQAEFVRCASIREKSQYLALFPVVRLVVAFRRNQVWFGFPATDSDRRFGLKNAIPICLAENCQQFDTVLSRFDGYRCWFEKRDPRRSIRIAKALRESLDQSQNPAELAIVGCNQSERKIYENALLRKLENLTDPDEIRIKQALVRGGAQFEAYRQIGDSFHVNYTVNGEQHASTVDKTSLNVQSAGICLEGFDANFDLQSLVGVILEGQRTGQIHRM